LYKGCSECSAYASPIVKSNGSLSTDSTLYGLRIVSHLKPSTHIDENSELTIGVSERQISG